MQCTLRTCELITLFFQSSLMVIAEVLLTIIIRTPRARPATSLAVAGEMSVGAAASIRGSGESSQAFN